MKHFTQNLRWLFLSLLLVVGSNAWADSYYKKITSTNEITSGGKYLIVYEGAKNAFNGSLADKLDAVSNYNEVTITDGVISPTSDNFFFTISSSDNSYTIKSASGLYCGQTANSNGLASSETTPYANDISFNDDGTVNIVSGGAYLRFNSASNQNRFRYYKSSSYAAQKAICLYKYTSGSGDAPSKTATTTTFINGEASYSITEGGSFTAPTATVTAGEATLDNAIIIYNSSDETVATVDENGAVNINGVGTTTIKATYEGDETYYGSTASYTLKVVAADLPAYTSLKELQENVTNTKTEIKLTLTDVYVTAVKGSNAYLSDGTYGALVYTSGHSLTAGQKLNGTIAANLQLFRGQTEITGFSTNGLTITEEALAAKEVTDLSTITAANQSLLVTLKNVTYDDSVLKDASGNSITPYTTFVSDLGLKSGKSYDITGIVILYNTTLEIAPRSADDIVDLSDEPEPAQKTDPTSAWYISREKTEAVPATVSVDLSEGTLNYYFDTTSEGDVSYTSSNANVATIDANGEITLVGTGTTTITATTAETDNYNSSKASFELTVTDESIVEPDNVETIKFSEKGYDNSDVIETCKGENFTLSFNKGTNSNSPKYYTDGTAIRIYGGGYMVVSSSKKLVKIVLTFGTGDKTNAITTDVGAYDSGIWTGSSKSVTFTIGGTSGHRRIASVTVTYEDATEETATIGAAGYTTFCPDYNVTLPEGVTAYTVSAITNGYATLAEVSTIKAGTPVILQGEAGEYALPIIEDAEAVRTNFLKVSDGTVTGAANIYALANKDGVGFYPVSSDVTIPAGKCYLETSAGEAAKERIDFDFNGATAIEAIATENAIADDVIYNLNGQRVTNPTKGIFIKNGKKVFVR